MRYRTLADGTVVSALGLGAMLFGSRTGEAASLAILDRFVAAGGSLIDTSDNYAFWVEGASGGESEAVLGRWLASRGIRDSVVLSTKVGAQPTVPGGTYFDSAEGLSAGAIRSALEGSLRRLGTDRVEVYWAHIEDRATPLEETVDALATLVEGGRIGVLGASNHALWQVERARALAGDRARYTGLQLRHSYLRPRLDVRTPGDLPFSDVTDEVLDYVRSEIDMTLWAYSPLLGGGYVHRERLGAVYDHPGTPARLTVLHEVARELEATVNQVVLAWLLDRGAVPIVGVSSVAQLEELLGATELTLDAEVRGRLDAGYAAAGTASARSRQ